MSNLTLLETIFVWYAVVVNALGIVNVFLSEKAPRKVGETFVFIMIVLAVPIVLPFLLYNIFDIRRKLKEKKEEGIEENE